ncbi:aryl hydrocarbon receptor-like [Antechinus flavipes]|uniref:aryl hydrocarbon receptor-like n=1 Tax=Antechinus flavipes TaxID=38775 RepID=UPI002235DF94|nr:aryl hydrocarbon receptor-like [Antechinus flavipes]
MLPAGGVYAVKKRKKPVPKSPKPPTPEGTKSNPSKRHRDRLNQELNKLTNLLPFPEDVRARLDKLSILRLAVGYLKVKGYFTAILKNLSTGGPDEQSANSRGNAMIPPHFTQEAFSEGDLLLQALHGFFIAVTADGYIFYVSPTVQDYLGFHQSDIIYQSVFELIHTDDRAMFRCQLHWSLNPPSFREAEQDSSSLPENESPLNNGSTMYDLRHPLPENPSFLDRSFVCRFRCLLDNSSGFMALDFHGRLKFLYGQNKKAEDGSLMPPQLALFAIAVPLQPLSILELRTKIYIFQTKHKLDFTPMACDARGKVLLGYTETELCMRGSGYQFIHAADMMYCAEKHVRMMKMGESGMTVFRLLTKKAGWLWVQSNARLVYKGGQPDCIIARQRVLSNEEGEEHLHKRATSQLPFNFATGEAVLYENNLSGFLSSLPPKKGLKAKKEAFLDPGAVDPNSLLGAMMQQDESAYVSRTVPAPSFSFPDVVQAPRGWGANDKNGKIIKDETDSLLTVIETLFEGNEPESNIFKASQHLDGEALGSHKWEESMFLVNPVESPSFQGRLQPGGSSRRDEVGLSPGSRKCGDFPPLNSTTSLQPLRHPAPPREPSPPTPPMNPFQRLLMNSPNEKDAGRSWEHHWPSVGPDPLVHLPPGLQETFPDSPQQIEGQSYEGPLTFGTCPNAMSAPEIRAASGQQSPVSSRQTSWLPQETGSASSTAAWPPTCTLASGKVARPSSGGDVSAQSGQLRPLDNQWLDPEPAGVSVPQGPSRGAKPCRGVGSLT